MFEILDDLCRRSSEIDSCMTSLEYAIIHFPLAKLQNSVVSDSVGNQSIDQDIYDLFMGLQRDLLGLRSLFTVFLRLLVQICDKLEEAERQVFKQIQTKLVRRWERLLDLVLSLENNLVQQIEHNARVKPPPRRLPFLVTYWKKEDEIALSADYKGQKGAAGKGVTSNVEFHSDIQSVVRSIKENNTPKEPKPPAVVAKSCAAMYTPMEEYRSTVRKQTMQDEGSQGKASQQLAQASLDPSTQGKTTSTRPDKTLYSSTQSKQAPSPNANFPPVTSPSSANGVNLYSSANQNSATPINQKSTGFSEQKSHFVVANHTASSSQGTISKRGENVAIQCCQCCAIIEIPVKNLIPLIGPEILKANLINNDPVIRQNNACPNEPIGNFSPVNASRANQNFNCNLNTNSSVFQGQSETPRNNLMLHEKKPQIIDHLAVVPTASVSEVKSQHKVSVENVLDLSNPEQKTLNNSRSHKEFLKEIKSGHKSVKDLFDDIDRSARNAITVGASNDVIISSTINRSQKPETTEEQKSQNSQQVENRTHSKFEATKKENPPANNEQKTFVCKTVIVPATNISQKTLDTLDDGLQSTRNEIFTSTPRLSDSSGETLEVAKPEQNSHHSLATSLALKLKDTKNSLTSGRIEPVTFTSNSESSQAQFTEEPNEKSGGVKGNSNLQIISKESSAKMLGDQQNLTKSRAVEQLNDKTILSATEELNNLAPDQVYVSQFRKKLQKFEFTPAVTATAE